MVLSKKIAYYRKSKNITQDALARQLGISNQAVSKWETDQSCPDVELLPKIADIFGITLDELFERECATKEDSDNNVTADVNKAGGTEKDVNESETDVSDKAVTDANESSENGEQIAKADSFKHKDNFTWEDDGTLRMVLYIGHKLVQKDELEGRFGEICKKVTFSYCGPALNVESCFNVSCGDVTGDVNAGGYVECGDVAGNVSAGNRVECADVEGNAAAGNCVECADVGGNVSAGSRVDCEAVSGNVSAGRDVGCTEVWGDVSAEGNVMCGDVQGDVKAGGNVECGDVGGDVYHD